MQALCPKRMTHGLDSLPVVIAGERHLLDVKLGTQVGERKTPDESLDVLLNSGAEHREVEVVSDDEQGEDILVGVEGEDERMRKLVVERLVRARMTSCWRRRVTTILHFLPVLFDIGAVEGFEVVLDEAHDLVGVLGAFHAERGAGRGVPVCAEHRAPPHVLEGEEPAVVRLDGHGGVLHDCRCPEATEGVDDMLSRECLGNRHGKIRAKLRGERGVNFWHSFRYDRLIGNSRKVGFFCRSARKPREHDELVVFAQKEKKKKKKRKLF